jgi:SIR2-like domain
MATRRRGANLNAAVAATPPVHATEEAQKKAILNFIASKVAAHECILFLGSAIHAPSPAGSPYAYTKDKCPPIGNQLAELLAAESGFIDEDKKDLQRVSQHYEYTLQRNALVTEIIKHVSNGKEPSPVLRALAELRFPLVITTNYDNLYELAIDAVNKKRAVDAARAAGQPVDEQAIEAATRKQYDVSIYNRDKKVETRDCERQLNPERPYILKIHGDISVPSSIVITDEDYIHFIMRMSDTDPHHPIGPNVATRLIENHILFIGYRLTDYNLRLLFKTLRWKKDVAEVPVSVAIDRDPDYLIRNVWEGREYAFKFVVDDLWNFVPALYRSVKKEEMPA